MYIFMYLCGELIAHWTVWKYTIRLVFLGHFVHKRYIMIIKEG